MSEVKKYVVFPKIPWQRKPSIQALLYLLNYTLNWAPELCPLPNTRSYTPSEDCIYLSTHYFDHSSMLGRNVFTWEWISWTLVVVQRGIQPGLSGNMHTVSTKDHDKPVSHSAEGEAAIAEAAVITDWPGSFFSTENVWEERASGLQSQTPAL